ncbi:MAG: ABC-2 family transporter protein [Herpetosiphonaceae bacterium]|nr:ABC-2 family transporter protein [Herpetosiphonaceae bacterium]
MTRLLPYLRLWRQFVVTAFVREAEYRFNLLVGVGEGLAQLALAVLTFLLLYQYTDAVAGWSRAQVLMLVGVYRIVDALINLQIAPNLTSIAGYIQRGEMDFLLLRPVESQFLVSLRKLELAEAGNMVSGLALLIYAGNQAHVHWSVANGVEAVAFAICGVLLLYAVWFLTVTLSFWLVKVGMDELFYGMFDTGRYPVSFFKGIVRTVLTFAIPVAFATTFPTQSLLGVVDHRLLLVGCALAAVGLVASHLFWNYAVQHYSSASS